MGERAAAIYAGGRAALHHADFLGIAGSMEAESVDMVFTDPPFELTGGGMKKVLSSTLGAPILSYIRQIK